MLTITDAQKAALDRERRDALIGRIDNWLQEEDPAWSRAPPDQRRGIVDALLTYGAQAGMACERDYAVFCRAAILLRADWQAFIEAPAQKQLLLDERAPAHSKLRAFYQRAEYAAAARQGQAAGASR